MYTTQIDHMDLHQIANSGQCFRWRQINDKGHIEDTFRIVSAAKAGII